MEAFLPDWLLASCSLASAWALRPRDTGNARGLADWWEAARAGLDTLANLESSILILGAGKDGKMEKSVGEVE